jgi:hypothetical protein
VPDVARDEDDVAAVGLDLFQQARCCHQSVGSSSNDEFPKRAGYGNLALCVDPRRDATVLCHHPAFLGGRRRRKAQVEVALLR